jgi:tungstate transport system substrate-binding protein
MMRRILSTTTLVALLFSLLVACAQVAPAPTPEPPAATVPAPEIVPEPTTAAAQPGRLILATTTSTENSGLLAFLLPDFEKEHGVKIDVVAVGTGQALQLGKDGNADVVLVHARAQEDQFMAEGHGVRREDVMYNDFIILGPPADPAGILGRNRASKALELIAQAEAPFVSRGDDSGTHVKEKEIWAEANIEPAGNWYIAAGQGMGAVLTMADEQQAYTLSDRATYLARTLEGTSLVILVEGDPILFNPYGVIAVNPNKGAHINADLANTFIDWFVSLEIQTKIAEFGAAEFGQSLFIPDSTAWREAGPPAGGGAAGDVALQITGLVDTPLAWSEDEVRAMEAIDVESTNKDGETATYTGVSINQLLDLAGVQEGAMAVVFVADDGYTAEATLDEVRSCNDCIVSFRNQGGFSTVLPGFSGKLQVKGVVEIQVK